MFVSVGIIVYLWAIKTKRLGFCTERLAFLQKTLGF